MLCKQKQTPLGETFLVHTFFLLNVSPPCSLAARFLVDPLSDFSLLGEGLFALDGAVGVRLEAILELRRVLSDGPASPDEFIRGMTYEHLKEVVCRGRYGRVSPSMRVANTSKIERDIAADSDLA